MAKKQLGFTLIEITVVLAISSTLAILAFAGQRQLKARSEFDAAVTKVASTVASAQTEATSGVRYLNAGNGNGQSDCAGAAANDYVFAGVAWVTPVNGPPEYRYYKASASAGKACVFDTQISSLPAPLKFNSTNPVADAQGARELFVRRNDGGLDICPITSAAAMNTTVLNYFLNGACPGGPMPIDIEDDQGHTAHIDILQSGLAKRTNP